MRLREWNRAENVLVNRLTTHPEDVLAMYQLSQVFLEDNRPKKALSMARKARKLTCGAPSQGRRSARAGSPGGKPELCVQILTQEADIWRELGKFKEAVEVIKIKTSSLSFSSFR